MIKKLTDFSLTFVLLAISSLAFLQFSYVKQAYAAPCEPANSFLGIPTWYKYLPGIEEGGKCTPQLNIDSDNQTDNERFNAVLPIGLAALEIMIRLAGLIAVVMVFIGSFRFLTSQGNPESAAGARKTIINALIGLVIVILATTIVNFIGNSLT